MAFKLSIFSNKHGEPENTNEKDSDNKEKYLLVKRNLWLGLAMNVVAAIVGLFGSFESVLYFGLIGTFVIGSSQIFFRKQPLLSFQIVIVFYTLTMILLPFVLGRLYSIPMIMLATFGVTLYIFDKRPVLFRRYTFFHIISILVAIILPVFVSFEEYPWQPLIDSMASISSMVFLISAFFSYRKQSLESRAQVESRRALLDAVMKSSLDIIWAISPGGEIMACNDAARKEMQRVTNSEFRVGDNILEIIDTDLREAYEHIFDTVLAGQTIHLEPQLEIDGKMQYYSTVFSPITGESGNIIGISVFSKNTSHLKEAELKRQESERKYRLIAENTSDIVCLHHPDTTFYFLSPSVAAVTGYMEAELLNQKAFDFIDARDSQLIRSVFEDTFRNGEKKRINLRFRHKAGHYIWLESAMSPVFDEKNKKVLYIQTTSRDITEKVRAQKLMEQRRQMIDKLVNYQEVIFFRFDKKANFLESVGRGLKTLSLQPNQVVGLNIFDVYAPYPKITNAFKQVFKENYVTYDVEIQTEENGTQFFNTSLSYDPVLGEGSGLSFNNTEHEQMLRKVQQSEARFRMFFDSSPLGVVIRDINTGEFLAANKKALEMTGYTRAEFIGMSRNQITIWEDAIEYDELLANLLDGKIEAFNNVKRFQRKDGKSFWARVYRTLVNIDGRNYLLGYVDNIDKEIEANRQIVKREKQYRLLFENAFDGLIIYDAKTRRAIDCNHQVLSYFKFDDKQAFLDTSPLELSPKYQPNGRRSSMLLRQYISELTAKGETHYEWKHLLADGSALYTEVSIFTIDINKETKNFISIFRDITEKKRQESLLKKQMIELNDKNAELQKYIDSNLQLENFAYVASHDMKAPLRTIISFSQLLHRSAQNKLEQKDLVYLDFIMKATRNLNDLIHGLLTYSKVDGHKAIFEEVQFRQLVNTILHELHSNIREKNANIFVKNLPELIIGDRVRLKQLMQNLIGNALKFSREGVVPEVLIEGFEKENRWEIMVQDNGLGIDQKFHDRIFILFQRLHTNDKIEGTGIGLAMCKKIVQQHGGNISLQSTPGEGTTFTISLPKKVQKPALS
ncbi:MAG: PAS domain S-box protein [Saprospiraceae bacterium]|nr:PAS domain S-box protein [Saprospiraceae bacterium]